MNIEVKGDVEFVVVDTITSSKHLNPFYININHIRYLREYINDDKDSKSKKALAFMLGEKMLITDDIIGIDNYNYGDKLKIGSVEFVCVEGSGLTDSSSKCKYFINYNNALYMRKYIDKNDKSGASDKFAVITIDERTVPIGNM